MTLVPIFHFLWLHLIFVAGETAKALGGGERLQKAAVQSASNSCASGNDSKILPHCLVTDPTPIKEN